MHSPNGSVDALVERIRQGIEQCGFFWLMDDGLFLICGWDWKDLSHSRTAIEAFAKNHHWRAEIEGRAVIFRSADL